MRASATRYGLCGLFVVVFATNADGNTMSDDAPWLGVGIEQGERGVRVKEVIRDTAAHDGGVQFGDEIIALDATRINTPSQLQSAIIKHRVDDRIVLTVWRAGKSVRLGLELGPRLSADEILYRRLVGRSAPGFELDVVFGTSSGSSIDLRGRVVVLQFFTLDCDPCIEQHARLSRFVDEQGQSDLTVIAVTGARRDLRSWSRRSSPSFSVARDPYMAAFFAFRIENHIPALVVINNLGVIRYAGVGGDHNLERAIATANRTLRRMRRRR